MCSRISRCLCAALLVLPSACALPHWYDYSFSPAPLEAEVEAPDDPDAELRVLVSILGVARGEGEKPDSIEVRMRLENLGKRPATLHTDNLALCSADLQLFGSPQVFPAVVPTVEAGRSETVDLAFPFPPKEHPPDLNLRGLNLRWTVSFDGHEVTTGASFTRSDWRAPYDDYPRVHAGITVSGSTAE